MTDARHHWTMAGGLFLAAAAGLPAAAQNPTDAPTGPVLSEPAAAPPVSNPPPPPVMPPAPLPYPEACPPSRLGPFGRWRQRCKTNCQDKMWGYPEEFQDAPLGAMLEGHLAAQISNGRAARMVLYQFDFVEGTERLKPRGKIQLARMAACLPQYAVVVEPSGGGLALDEARRATVLRLLAGDEFRIPAAQVIVGRPTVGGLRGPDGVLVDRNLSTQTSARGMAAGSGSSGASAGGMSGGASGTTTSASPIYAR